jgi:hypothetical protein
MEIQIHGILEDVEERIIKTGEIDLSIRKYNVL